MLVSKAFHNNICSILKELRKIVHGDMELQTHHIQVLLANELDWYKDKGEERVNKHIKELQEVYQEIYQDIPQPMVVNKGKQKEKVVQDEEVFLYKPYAISLELSRPIILKPIFLIEEVDNLERALKILQSPIKTIPFLSLAHYKTIWQDGENNIQYWKEIVAEFIKWKHNLNMSC